jgi:protein gp37
MSTQFNERTRARGIEWTDRTINATGGCLHGCQWKIPDGTIAICYAEHLAESGVAKRAYPDGFAHHYFRPQVLSELPRGAEPELIFVDSMSDLFAANVPEEHVRAVLSAMREGPHHTYQSLTKAAPGILKYVNEIPPNLWVGVSSPPDFMHGHPLSRRQQIAMLRRALDVLAEVRERTDNIVWLSAEPVSWDLASVIDETHPLDWVVIGAASNGRKYYQPDAAHIRRLLALFDRTATPVFFKGNIAPLIRSQPFGDVELDRWREDFPITYHDGQPIPAVMRRQARCQQYGWTVSRPYRASAVKVVLSTS